MEKEIEAEAPKEIVELGKYSITGGKVPTRFMNYTSLVFTIPKKSKSLNQTSPILVQTYFQSIYKDIKNENVKYINDDR